MRVDLVKLRLKKETVMYRGNSIKQVKEFKGYLEEEKDPVKKKIFYM